jgi:hypothetical protein
MATEHPPLPLCRTLDECEAAGREYVRRRGWKLTDRQRERLTVLLRPYADRLLPPEDAARSAS